MTRLFELNEYLQRFPPFGHNQQLPLDESLDIAEFAVPQSWQCTMHMHGFVPILHDENTLIEFCECIEFLEGPTDNQESMKNKNRSQPNDQSNQQDNDHKQVANCRSTEEAGPFWCKLHHENDTHSMGGCKTLKRQAQAMCRNYEMHKKAFRDVTKKHMSFKPQNPFQKKDWEEQHQLEAIVKSILNKKKQSETVELDEFTDLHIDDENENDNENEVENDMETVDSDK